MRLKLYGAWQATSSISLPKSFQTRSHLSKLTISRLAA